MPDLWSLPATDLVDRLSRKEISSVEATQAHLARIDAVQGRLRAFTAVFHERALEEARRADDARARGDVKGPLHGLPVSVKESIDMAGLAATMGVPSRRNLLAARDGAMIQMLREAGAVILGRTNVSQFLIFHESRNPLFGECANPWSLSHTPGGSSGGEASAIASGCSPLGIGTDIGGSIRVPAFFAGICGLKPGVDRWTNRGSNTSMPGQEAVRGQIGPMARTTRDLVLAMKTLDPRRMSELDGRVAPVPFEDPARFFAKGAKLPKLGVMVDDGILPSSRACVRAIERAAEVMRARGCQVVPFTPPKIAEGIDLFFQAMSADGGETIAPALEGGEIDPVLKALSRMARMPGKVRLGIARGLDMLGEKRASRLLRQVGEKRVRDLFRITNEIRAWRFTVTEAMNEAGIDALLCPTFATPALPHGKSKDFAVAGSPSMIWNVLHFPGGVVPVTRVRRDETQRAGARDRFEKMAAEVDRQSLGLPVGVQVVARPWQEDLVLAVMQEIESAVSSDDGFPRTPVVM